MTKFTITLLAIALSAGAALAKQPEKKNDSAKQSTAASEDAASGDTVDTPFGKVAKQKPAPRPASRSKAPSMVEVRIDGDTVRFSRKTPFGAQNWTRKKSELSTSEKDLVKEAGLSLDAAPAKAEPKS